jgi:LPXTG-motif cell wall-anchored protein
MNVSNLYTSKAFYDSTSALGGNPFVNPRTCGMSGTLRGSCLASNLSTCGLAAFPGGNIGYANRVEGTADFLSDLATGAKNVGQNILGFIAPTVGAAAEALLGTAMKKAREAVGYKFLEVVQVPYQGKQVAGTKAQKPDGSFVVVLADGTELPFTSDLAKQTQTVNPQTGLPAGATAGLAVGAVALVALLYFMSKRR